jgi:hypothetical protein
VWRYYLLCVRPEAADADFKWSELQVCMELVWQVAAMELKVLNSGGEWDLSLARLDSSLLQEGQVNCAPRSLLRCLQL